MRWVRPDFTMSRNSSAFFSSEVARTSRAGLRSFTSAFVTATCTEVGNTSLDDCEAFTWSLGWTVTSVPASSWFASCDRTSFVFMFEEVPEPVWNTSMGKCASKSPEMTLSAAERIAAARWESSTSSSSFAVAAAFFTWASAAMCSRSSVLPEMGKFSTARCVCAL